MGNDSRNIHALNNHYFNDEKHETAENQRGESADQ